MVLESPYCGLGGVRGAHSADRLPSGIVKTGPGWAWPGMCPAKAPCSSCLRAASVRPNGLAYSRCLANTNDLAMPLRFPAKIFCYTVQKEGDPHIDMHSTYI